MEKKTKSSKHAKQPHSSFSSLQQHIMEEETVWKVFISMVGSLFLVFLVNTILLLTSLKDFLDPMKDFLEASPAVSIAITCLILLLFLFLAFGGRMLEGRLLLSSSLLLLATTSSGLLTFLLTTTFPATTAPVLLAIFIFMVTLLLTTAIAYTFSLSPKTWSTWLTPLAVFTCTLLLLLAWDSWIGQDFILLFSSWDIVYGGLAAADLLLIIQLASYQLLKDGRFKNTVNINLVLLSFIWLHLLILLVAVIVAIGAIGVATGGAGCDNCDCEGCGDCQGCGSVGGGHNERRAEEGQVGVQE